MWLEEEKQKLLEQSAQFLATHKKDWWSDPLAREYARYCMDTIEQKMSVKINELEEDAWKYRELTK